MSKAVRVLANGSTKTYYFDGSTKTYYFEMFVGEPKLVSILEKYLEHELCYYRYLTYPIIDENITKWVKIIGILQFNKRLAKSVLRQMFVLDHVFMDMLQPAVSPTVLVHMKMYVIAEHHGVAWASTKCSNTPFGFGGRKTRNEGKFMKSYMKALSVYKDYDKPDFYYKDLRGAKRICKFKYMLEKSRINI
jgi:hypothetical protein